MFLKVGSVNDDGNEGERKRCSPWCCFQRKEAYSNTTNSNNNNENEGEKVTKKSDVFMKYLCLVSLTVQNAAYVQVLKYSRIGPEDELFIPSTAVCLAEGLKLGSSCLLMVKYETRSWRDFYMFFYNSIFEKPLDTLNVGVPAICYVVMTNLTYVSSTYLDVITFQIVSQLKIPATVAFAILLLSRAFRKLQYLSLVMLMVGAAVVQVTEVDDQSNKNVGEMNTIGKYQIPYRTFGIITGILACSLSGFAGVYFERILKETNDLNVWSRNVQLSIMSLPPAFLQTFVYDWDQVSTKGFFHGYNYVVWLVIVLQALGGLIVALSMKLADNVTKGYATAASIVVSGISSTLIFQYRFSYQFAFGASLVVLSIPLYGVNFGSGKTELTKMDTEEGGG